MKKDPVSFECKTAYLKTFFYKSDWPIYLSKKCMDKIHKFLLDPYAYRTAIERIYEKQISLNLLEFMNCCEGYGA